MLTGISSSNRCFSHFAAGEEPRLLAMASQDGNKDKAVTLNPVIRSVAGATHLHIHDAQRNSQPPERAKYRAWQRSHLNRPWQSSSQPSLCSSGGSFS